MGFNRIRPSTYQWRKDSRAHFQVVWTFRSWTADYPFAVLSATAQLKDNAASENHKKRFPLFQSKFYPLNTQMPKLFRNLLLLVSACLLFSRFQSHCGAIMTVFFIVNLVKQASSQNASRKIKWMENSVPHAGQWAFQRHLVTYA